MMSGIQPLNFVFVLFRTKNKPITAVPAIRMSIIRSQRSGLNTFGKETISAETTSKKRVYGISKYLVFINGLPVNRCFSEKLYRSYMRKFYPELIQGQRHRILFSDPASKYSGNRGTSGFPLFICIILFVHPRVEYSYRIAIGENA